MWFPPSLPILLQSSNSLIFVLSHCYLKTDVPDLVRYLNNEPDTCTWVVGGQQCLQEWTPEWHVFEINYDRPHAQIVIIVPGSIDNTMEGNYMATYWTRGLRLIRYSFELQNLRGKRLRPQFGLAHHHNWLCLYKEHAQDLNLFQTFW